MVLLIVAVWRKSTLVSWAAVTWGLGYLALGLVQNHRAMEVAAELAESRGHTPINHGVKPSFANIIAWKSVYEHEGRYYVDAIRVLGSSRVYPGLSTEKLDVERHFPWLDPNSQQARDVQRFAWFSNQHLGLDPENRNRIIDIRYSLLPNRMDGMWGIVLSPQRPADEHVEWNTNRPPPSELEDNFSALWRFIRGD